MNTWSYSALKTFETCPKQYYHTKILKEFPFQETEDTRYGKQFHKACEDYIRSGTALPNRFSFIKPVLDELLAKPGRKLCEERLGITEDLKPCEFFDKNVWFRGIIDLLIIDGDRAFVVDYKTGKTARYADPDQLELMAMCVFKHYPIVKKVNAGLMFVIANAFIKETYIVQDADALWVKYLTRQGRINTAHETGVWNPKSSGLCKRHCPVLECWHNGLN